MVAHLGKMHIFRVDASTIVPKFLRPYMSIRATKFCMVINLSEMKRLQGLPCAPVLDGGVSSQNFVARMLASVLFAVANLLVSI